jgi:hypothetical protein
MDDPIANEHPEDSALPLALRAPAAAKALGIGVRLLWSKTNAGEIPCVRIGRTVVYPVHLLRDWLTQQATGGSQ